MNEIVFEAKSEQLLESAGLTKAEFARRMGIQRQNVMALFRSRNLDVIRRASEVLGLPLIWLLSYVDEPDFNLPPASKDEEEIEILPEDIPTGDSVEDRRIRQRIIFSFYRHWREIHPEMRMFNDSLGDWIYVRHISVDETAGQASLTYLSTLAVLQLDTILRDAVLVDEREVKKNSGNQKHFKKMLYMKDSLPGLGVVKLMVGVKPRDNSKVQYCITAIDVSCPHNKQSSLKRDCL